MTETPSQSYLAAKRLEEIQAAYYAHYEIPPPDHSDTQSFVDESVLKQVWQGISESGPGFDEVRAEYEKRLRESISKAPTKFEDPQWYSIVLGLVEDIEQSIKARGWSSFKRPLIGTVPSGRLNGMAIGIDNSEHYLVLLEDGLFGFANLFSKVVAHAMPMLDSDRPGYQSFSTDIELVRKRVSESRVHAERLLDLLISYVVFGHPHRAKPYLPEPRYNFLIGLFREGMELFIVGHEFGHCIANHLEGDVRRGLPVETSNERIDEEIVTSWKDEIEADVLGCVLTLDAQMRAKKPPELGFSGITLFFGAVHIVESFVSVLRSGSVSVQFSSTHPPPAFRREALLEFVKTAMKDEDGVEAYGNLKHLSDAIWEIVELLWEQALPIVIKLREQGAAVGGQWKTSFVDQPAG
jgi:hypothetical protein